MKISVQKSKSAVVETAKMLYKACELPDPSQRTCRDPVWINVGFAYSGMYFKLSQKLLCPLL